MKYRIVEKKQGKGDLQWLKDKFYVQREISVQDEEVNENWGILSYSIKKEWETISGPLETETDAKIAIRNHMMFGDCYITKIVNEYEDNSGTLPTAGGSDVGGDTDQVRKSGAEGEDKSDAGDGPR